MRVRPPAVAGTFYPDDPDVLRTTVDGLLQGAEGQGLPPKALIAPHAGYAYSGPMAALAYAPLLTRPQHIRHVVLLGPCHRTGLPGLALPGADALATPLGEVSVWAEGVALAGGLSQVVTSAAVHAYEHSLEVHLPFLQRTLRGFDVLPLAVGWAPSEDVAAVIDLVYGGPETLIVVSSDLSHYHSYADARRRDQATLGQILALDGRLDPEQACGAHPVNGLLVAAVHHGLRASLVGSCNSGDASGDRRRVVGYAAVRFDGPDPADDPAWSEHD
jgi:AmmeMemoRadiSam system protein B